MPKCYESVALSKKYTWAPSLYIDKIMDVQTLRKIGHHFPKVHELQIVYSLKHTLSNSERNFNFHVEKICWLFYPMCQYKRSNLKI